MAIHVTLPDNKVNFLRRVLQTDGFLSGLSGLGLTFGAGPASSFLGLHAAWVLVVVGIGLIVYAAGLFYTAAQETIDRRFVAVIIGLNVAWVIGSGEILFTDWLLLTVAGWWAVAVVADVVAVLAALQYYGLRRL